MEIVLKAPLQVVSLKNAVDEALRALRSWSSIRLPDQLSAVNKSLVTGVVGLALSLAKNVKRGTDTSYLVDLKGKYEDASVYLGELASGLSDGCYNLPSESIQLVVTGEFPIYPGHLILANHTIRGGTITLFNTVEPGANSFGITYSVDGATLNRPLQEVNVVVEEANPGRLDPDALQKTLQHLAAAA